MQLTILAGHCCSPRPEQKPCSRATTNESFTCNNFTNSTVPCHVQLRLGLASNALQKPKLADTICVSITSQRIMGTCTGAIPVHSNSYFLKPHVFISRPLFTHVPQVADAVIICRILHVHHVELTELVMFQAASVAVFTIVGQMKSAAPSTIWPHVVVGTRLEAINFDELHGLSEPTGMEPELKTHRIDAREHHKRLVMVCLRSAQQDTVPSKQRYWNPFVQECGWVPASLIQAACVMHNSVLHQVPKGAHRMWD